MARRKQRRNVRVRRTLDPISKDLLSIDASVNEMRTPAVAGDIFSVFDAGVREIENPTVGRDLASINEAARLKSPEVTDLRQTHGAGELFGAEVLVAATNDFRFTNNDFVSDEDISLNPFRPSRKRALIELEAAKAVLRRRGRVPTPPLPQSLERRARARVRRQTQRRLVKKIKPVRRNSGRASAVASQKQQQETRSIIERLKKIRTQPKPKKTNSSTDLTPDERD